MAVGELGAQPYRRQVPPRVEDVLQAYIIDHGFHPGDRLPTEAEFGEALGVGRNAIREAMRGLQSLAIVEIRHGFGAYLAQASLPPIDASITFWGKILRKHGDDHVLTRIADARNQIESALIAEVCGRHEQQDYLDLRRCIAELAEAAGRGERNIDADRRFHEVLYRPLDNWILTGMLATLWDSTLSLSSDQSVPDDLATVAADHAAIVDALEAEDPAAAVEAMRRHFRPMLTVAYTD